MQGVGNDFVVVAAHDVVDKSLPDLALTLCERRFSIGADGLLVIGRPSSDAAFSFRMFNPDGSEDMCGNGMRCAALWAHRHGLVNYGGFHVDTKDGRRDCNLISVSKRSAIVAVNMGAPKFGAADLPMTGSLSTFVAQPIQVLDRSFLSTVVNTGSTHSVVFLNAPVDDRTFFTYSPTFENLSIFPERTSVLWTWNSGHDRFAVRIWERGAGETLGCGTGACAAAVAAVLNGKANRAEDILISSKGGDLTIRWTDTIWMTGPAELVFEGEIGQ